MWGRQEKVIYNGENLNVASNSLEKHFIIEDMEQNLDDSQKIKAKSLI